MEPGDLPDSDCPTFDPDRARRAARHPARPGRACRAEPGTAHIVVDRTRCEGKGECAAVCPYGVFEVGRMSDEDFSCLPVLAKLKSWAHRRRTAYVPGVEACQACGLCVVACPERALQLILTDTP